MVCPHKKIVTKIEEKDETGSKKTVVEITFGKCEEVLCPYFVIFAETCMLKESRNK